MRLFFLISFSALLQNTQAGSIITSNHTLIKYTIEAKNGRVDSININDPNESYIHDCSRQSISIMDPHNGVWKSIKINDIISSYCFDRDSTIAIFVSQSNSKARDYPTLIGMTFYNNKLHPISNDSICGKRIPNSCRKISNYTQPFNYDRVVCSEYGFFDHNLFCSFFSGKISKFADMQVIAGWTQNGSANFATDNGKIISISRHGSTIRNAWGNWVMNITDVNRHKWIKYPDSKKYSTCFSYKFYNKDSVTKFYCNTSSSLDSFDIYPNFHKLPP